MRGRVILAAIVAAALFGGGAATRAMTDGPSPGWFFTPIDNRVQTGATAGSSNEVTPGFDLGDASAAPFAAATPLAFGVASPVGSLYASGYSATLTVPHLLSGGIIARDGPFYTVRDLEIVDELTPDIAVDFGFDINRGSGFDVSDIRSAPANQGLFFSLADFETPYALPGDNAVHTGAKFGLGNGLSVSFGQSLLSSGLAASSSSWTQPAGVAFDQREAETSLAGGNWQFAPWGGVGLMATHSTDRVGLLGGGSPADSLSLAKSATTTLGATGQFAFGGGWITSFSYNEAITQLDLRPAGSELAAESLRSRSYGLAVARHGLFGGDDSLGLAVSRPLEIAPGGVDLGGAATADPFDGFISSTTHPIMSGESSETDLQLGYVTTFMDGALALQANAGYQMNVAGQSGNNGVTVLSRAKINF